MSSVVKPIDIQVTEGVLELPDSFSLHFGGVLSSVRIAWRLAGAANAPVVAVLGGISAGRNVFATAKQAVGWWKDIVGLDAPLDARRYQILGIDFLGGSGETTGPKAGQTDFPSVSAFDQATILTYLLTHLGLDKFYAIVGASYGGMVALAFAERYGNRVDRIVVISAADRPHPMASAWRSVQRATVRALAMRGAGAEGLKLARSLAMATYRSPQEFKQRFDGVPKRTDTGFRLPVEDYLYARGQAYSESYVPEAFVCLSESIDLHCVAPANIRVPTTLVAVVEDQLVPLSDVQSLYARLAGPRKLVELSSLYGHDAFLKESTALEKVFAEAL
jgi:homoserine O-acetyltransferase/O-succinyltransferase